MPPTGPRTPSSTDLLLSTSLSPSWLPLPAAPLPNLNLRQAITSAPLTITPTQILKACGVDVDIWVPLPAARGGIKGIGVLVDLGGGEECDGGGVDTSVEDVFYRIRGIYKNLSTPGETTISSEIVIAVAVLGMAKFAEYQIGLHFPSNTSTRGYNSNNFNTDIQFRSSIPLLIPLTSPQDLFPALDKYMGGLLSELLQSPHNYTEEHHHGSSIALLRQMSSEPPLRTHTTYVLHDMYPSIAALARDVTVEKLRMVVGEREGDGEEAERVVRFLERDWVVQL